MGTVGTKLTVQSTQRMVPKSNWWLVSSGVCKILRLIPLSVNNLKNGTDNTLNKSVESTKLEADMLEGSAVIQRDLKRLVGTL